MDHTDFMITSMLDCTLKHLQDETLYPKVSRATLAQLPTAAGCIIMWARTLMLELALCT